MGREKSDGSIQPEGRRKTVPTASPRGGKGATVSQQARQLELFPETADSPQGDVAVVEVGQPIPTARAVPKSGDTTRSLLPAMSIKEVASYNNLRLAFEQVAANRGAPGPDRVTIDEVRQHLDVVLPAIQSALLSGDYRPGMIRRVWLPKPDGGRRGLGIPDVVDRVVGQAVYRVMSPHYEPTFHPSSHGFRPRKSCHTAIAEAQAYVADGYEWVVDLDLERFFDRVHHDRLIARLEQRVKDPALLQLIRRMLKAKVVLPDGVIVATEEGTPQGAPLSPLLSNIVLDELDRELARRGHRFVRYADDCNVYVRSERSGQRVMSSICRFIETRLRLKVNLGKSAVARPQDRHFVGFRLRPSVNGSVDVLLSLRSQRRIRDRIRELTPRLSHGSVADCIQQLNLYLKGWVNFFWICTKAEDWVFYGLDAHIRRRLRAIVLRHWKRKRTIVRRLVQLGIKSSAAHRVYGRHRSWWAMTKLPSVQMGLRNAFFADLGLFSLREWWLAKWAQIANAPTQLEFAWDS